MLSTRYLAQRLAALCLVSVLGFTGCAHAGQNDATGDAISALAQGGVAVSEDVTTTTAIVAPSGTPSAMRMTRWQVRNLLAEAQAHNGYLGAELDRLGTPPPGVPPFSAFIAAWLQRDQGPLAQFAQRFVPNPDYHHASAMLFPSLVVLSFIADIARVGPSALVAPHPFELGRYIAGPAEADGVCSDVSGYVSSVVNDVNAALQSNGTSWLSSVWNAVVTVVGTAISAAIGTVLAFVTRVATIAGALMQVSSLFKPWSVTLASDPASVTLGPDPQNGTFTATLDAQPVQWPSSLVDCVQALSGVKLDEASYTDAPVTWSQPIGIPPGLATNTSSDATLRSDKTAVYAYQTIPETPPSCPLLVPEGQIGITVTVTRSDITKVIGTLESLITGAIPSAAIRSYLTPFLQPALNAASQTANQFPAPSAHGIVMVEGHVADPAQLCHQSPSPPPSPSEAPTQNGGVVHLPLLPCDQLIALSDVQAGFPGITRVHPDKEQEMVPFILNLLSGAIPIYGRSETAPVFSTEHTTMCFYGTEAARNDPTVVIEVLPAYLPLGVPQSTPCRDAIGPELSHFGAVCLESNDGVMTVIYDSVAEYGIGQFISTPTSPKPAAPGSSSASAAGSMQLLQHLLRRLEQ